MGRFLNADALVSTGQGVLGNNMFAYCCNNPVKYIDPNGQEPITFTVTITAAGVVTVVIFIAGVAIAAYYAVLAIWELGSWIADLLQTDWAAKSCTKEVAEPEPPDVTYPGDDPKQAPEGSEWRGSGEQGSNQGNYYDSDANRSWHPDLEHEPPIGPHWDIKDDGIWWRIFPDGTIAMK